jgi:cytochrome c peroxidase
MRTISGALLAAACLQVWSGNAGAAGPNTGALEELGKRVFFDEISVPNTQSCASCHNADAGWTSPSAIINAGQVVFPGAVRKRAGGRKPPSIAYASKIPAFGDSPLVGVVIPGLPPTPPCAEGTNALSCAGGVFWDGRATGHTIGAEVFGGDPALTAAYEDFLGPLADQALGPFPNDVEQNVPDGRDNGLPGAEFVCRHVAAARYAELYKKAWGAAPDCRKGVDISFKRIAVAIAAWEHSKEVNSFSSLRDLALAQDSDSTPGEFPLSDFSDQENLGHDLFYGITSGLNPTGKNANCSACHNSAGPGSRGNEPDQIYTDGGFHHLGLPPNFEIANFDPKNPDVGLAEHTAPAAPEASGHAGAFRTTTLRNVDRRASDGFKKAYMHNGYFKRLEDVVHFYNTATLKLDPVKCPAGTTAAQARARDCWPAAEVNNGRQVSAFGLLGNLGLSTNEEDAIVAYLQTLTDTQEVKKPRPYVPGKGKY